MRFQFTLQTLLLSVVVIWSSMAAFGPGGLALAPIVLGVLALYRSSKRIWHAIGVVGLFILCGAGLLGFLLGFVYDAHLAARRLYCRHNLRRLAIALRAYRDDYGCFPPAYIADPSGKPAHSWRVLILPYMEEQPLYEQYDFSEPWDGPNNCKLTEQGVGAFHCPCSRSWLNGPAMTDYVAVVGKKTSWPGANPRKVEDIRDGTHGTIMLVEIDDSHIKWTEPRDLSFEEALRDINPESGVGISSQHVWDTGYFFPAPIGVNVAFADGTASSLREGIPPEMLEGLLTIDGGETVETDYWVPPRVNWTNCFAVVALVVSVLLVLLRPRRREPQGPQSLGVDSR